jgi:hypothetical protein
VCLGGDINFAFRVVHDDHELASALWHLSTGRARRSGGDRCRPMTGPSAARSDTDSIIFADELERLQAGSGGRLWVHHHLDLEEGLSRRTRLRRAGP